MLKDLLELQAHSEFLSQLAEEDLVALAQELQESDYSSGQVVFEAGDSGDCVFLVLEGTVTLDKTAQTGGFGQNEDRKAGQLVGVIGFSAGMQRQTAARCSEDCRLAKLTREQLNHLLETSPAVWHKLELMAIQRMREAQLAKHLDRVFGPFGHLLPFVLQEVIDHSEWQTLKSGESLYEAGEESDGAYLLLTGRLSVAKVTADGEEVINTVLSGETIGEVALLTKRNQTHTVYAARDSELVKLSPHIFELMLQRSAKAMYKVSRILVNRLVHRRTDEESMRMPIRCISLVPVDGKAPLRELAEDLARRLGEHGATRLLTGDSVAAELGMPGAAHATESEPLYLRMTEWLHEQESANRYLVFKSDEAWNTWTERCARVADKLIVVADATSGFTLAELDGKLSGPRRSWSLVIVHPADTARPHNTANYLKDIGAESVYHVRRGNDADHARLARILSGRAFSLVLGGGGARGLAHLGVFRALEELGIPVDLVGGTSIGALLAGWVGQGKTAAEALRSAVEPFSSLMDLTLPTTSMLAGKRISAMINHQTAAWDIEDYWIPFFCVSTNLTTSKIKIHRRGNSARAIRSSLSIPGVLPPVPENGELLVDGGVLNNLPVDVMRESNPHGIVIAVNVAAPAGPVAKVDYGMSVSGWRLLFNRLNPFRKADEVPGIASTIMHSMMVGSSQARERAQEQNLADLILNIHVRGVGMMQFDVDTVNKAAEVGYEKSIGPLREWAIDALSYDAGPARPSAELR